MILPTFETEERLWNEGFSRIVGIDEVGRGSYAGPLYVGGVLFPSRIDIKNVRDSKLLSEKQRFTVLSEIRKNCEHHTGHAEHFEVDALGLTAATELAINRLIASFTKAPDILLIDDGNYSFSFDIPVTYIKKGDLHVMSIAAGSIVAKVERDEVMKGLSVLYPEYGLDRNKGYASKEHRDVLDRIGPSKIHRRSFAPIARLLTQKKYAITA